MSLGSGSGGKDAYIIKDAHSKANYNMGDARFMAADSAEKPLLVVDGGLINNLTRIIPKNLCINIHLDKIRTTNIFKWLKKNNISDSEMLKTFNCGVGFCLIANKKNVKKIKRIFSKEYQPYQIGFLSKGKPRIKTFGQMQW